MNAVALTPHVVALADAYAAQTGRFISGIGRDAHRGLSSAGTTVLTGQAG
jgi:hypothetical protein